ncbi:MAG TPA: TauD/TfdA family dioxygenase [Puia sp.]|jgi:hypothetical protein|nr:TauD/TfdA family dioxygenase [Puia sp.]
MEFLNEVVAKEPLNERRGQLLPLVIKPAHSGVDLVSWIKGNMDQFEADLTRHGGILLRGFGVDTVQAFNDFMACFNTDPLPYMFRSSPRKELDESFKNIYFSTSYPNKRFINMHNESSYSRMWGRKIIFCCLKPAEEGGETPITDSRRVLKDLNPRLVSKFRSGGVKYRRNLRPDLGMPWQEVFQTDDINVAIGTCRRYRIDYKFDGDENFTIEWVKPAIYRHPVSGEEVWFNHVFFFNKFARFEELGLSADDPLPSDFLTSDTFFGDGSEITYQEYLEIKDAYEKNKVIFPYQKGDILYLDNMLAAHGRNPYKGERIIATAIIEGIYDADVML